MSDIPNLKLIKAVDPTKIKVTINEKFSKLTLSSNKKRNNEPTKPADPVEVNKRQSASRNLLDDLGDNADNNVVKYSNPILQSSSSSSVDYHEKKNKSELTETLTQLNDESRATQSSMEHLQISDENDLDDITQKISDLTVDQNVVGVKRESILYETASSFVETEVIDLDSDVSVNGNDIEEEESIICVSDSDEDENLPPGPEDQYNLMITSDIANSGQTGEPELPCTLSNERADRIEAFLRDVSQERQNIVATGGGLAEDSFLVHLPTSIENNENALRDSFKAKLMATAETESMKTNTESMRPSTDYQKQKELAQNDEKNLQNSLKAKQMANADTESLETNTESIRALTDSGKQQNMALNDTEPMNESAEISFLPEHEKSLSVQTKSLKRQQLAARRFANDETQPNTSLECSNDTVQDSDQSQASILPEESIVIPETSYEESNASEPSNAELSHGNENGLIPSEEALSESIRQTSYGFEATPTPIGLSVGSINISAKINIKLQFRTNLSLSDQSGIEDHADGEDRDDTSTLDENNENDQNVCSKASSEYIGAEKHAPKFDYNPKPCTPKTNRNDDGLTNAEKLLTELYGQSWKTPDILKSLKRLNEPKNVNRERPKSKIDNTLKSKNAPKKSNNVEDSQLLDNFSTFRINIEKTNMDSTRLVTPNTRGKTKKSSTKNPRTEPRQQKNTAKNNVRNAFKAPQTEFKKKPKKAVNERWRNLVDDESEPEQNVVSDDDDIEKTILTDDESGNEDQASNASDSSWQALTEEENSELDDIEINEKKSKARGKSKIQRKPKPPKDELIYLDLSSEEVSIVEPAESPPANHDENFRKRLSELLDSCRHIERPKLEATPKSTVRTKRRLFTANPGYEDIDDGTAKEEVLNEVNLNTDKPDEDLESVRFNGVLIPPSFNIFNKRLETVKTGKPVFKITPPRLKEPKTPIDAREETFKTPQTITTSKLKDKHKLNELCSTPAFKYSFLKSLDVCVGKSMCHPDALVFRENYRQKKEDLANILYELYNSKLFNNDLNVPIQWNKKLLNTAGRCLNKKKFGQRLSVVELSDKVLTSADRLRCTLIHELCHAATWVFNEESGHGATWKEWTRKANMTFPDLPKIGVCHQYDIEYKYTYKCTLCAAKSYYHSKSKKVENIRCSYCHGAIEIFLNKKDKEGNIMPTPVREPTGFAKFVKDKYQQYKRPNLKHAEVMKLLSNEYAALKVSDKGK